MADKKSQGMNHVHILGNVAAPCAVQQGGPMGGSFIVIRLDVIERVKVEEEWTDRSNVLPIIVTGKRAESLAPILKEGDRILIEDGKLRRGKAGMYVHAASVILCGGKKKKEEPAAGGGGGGNDWGGGNEDEIPF